MDVTTVSGVPTQQETIQQPTPKVTRKKAKAKVKKVGKKAGKKTSKKAPKGKLGRKPGVWSVLQAGKLQPWRVSNKLSRAVLAKMLDVSPTSIQNWETGKAIPSTKFQQAIVGLMSNFQPPSNAPKNVYLGSGRRNNQQPSVDLRAVGDIVVSFVSKSSGSLSVENLVALIGAVRTALA